MRSRSSITGEPDWISILLYLALVAFGWLSIYAASVDDLSHGILDMSTRYGKQLVWIALALTLAVFIFLIDEKFFSAFAYLFYFLMILVLVGVLLFGKTVAGSKSWFQIGSFAIQPAEFAKFATALALSKYLSTLHVDIRQAKTKIIALTILSVPTMLILLQNDTGSALVYFSFVLVLYREGFSGIIIVLAVVMAALFILTLWFGKLYVGGGLVLLAVLYLVFNKKKKRKWLNTFGVLALALAFVFSVQYAFEHVLEPHQKSRIQVLLGMKKDIHNAGYNVNQAKIAIGSGGLTGKGYLKGMLTRNRFVPEQSTDFIFCTIGEERGFAGIVVLFVLFVSLLIRLIYLAERQRSRFSRIYGYSVVSILFFHFTVNIGMTIGFAPVVGIPLPFFSYGGSSLWAFTILLFIFLKQDAKRLNVL